MDLFAREKGIDIQAKEVQVDVLGKANRDNESLRRNPAGQIPYFELEDGSIIAETISMMEYMEELKPEPALIGNTAVERAIVRMWQRRMEENFIYPLASAYRFWTASTDCEGNMKGFFEGRAPMLIPEAWERQKEWALVQLKFLEAQKEESPSNFIAGDNLTYVDLQVYAALYFFAQPGFGDILNDNQEDLMWCATFFERMKSRPSVQASHAYVAALMSK